MEWAKIPAEKCMCLVSPYRKNRRYQPTLTKWHKLVLNSLYGWTTEEKLMCSILTDRVASYSTIRKIKIQTQICIFVISHQPLLLGFVASGFVIGSIWSIRVNISLFTISKCSGWNRITANPKNITNDFSVTTNNVTIILLIQTFQH